MSEDNAKKIDRILREPLQRGAFDTMSAVAADDFKLTPYQPGRVVSVGRREDSDG